MGVGVYVVGGATRFFEQQSNLRSAGAGLKILADVPLRGSMSLMVMPQAGFLWQGYRADSAGGSIQARELQLTIPVFLTLHLHDAVVIGFGPELAVHKRLSDTGPEPDRAPYVRGGLSSVLLASF